MRYYAQKPVLPVNERKVAQVFAVTVEQVKSIEARLTTPKQQVLELRISFSVQADYLAIEHCAFDSALQRKRETEVREGFELVAIARHQFAAAIFDVRERAETIPLDLEQPIRMIERFGPPVEEHWLKRQHHLQMIADANLFGNYAAAFTPWAAFTAFRITSITTCGFDSITTWLLAISVV